MKKIVVIVMILSSLMVANSNNNESNKTVWNVKPLEQTYVLEYDKNTSCLVRQLLVYKGPKWVSKIVVRSGKSVYFCSPKSMFEFYHRPGKWFEVGVKNERDFSKIVVTDYETLKPINGETAFYVYGSNETSPAGDDLPAFATQKSAEKFSKAHKGKRIMPFDKVSDALIRLLNGRI